MFYLFKQEDLIFLSLFISYVQDNENVMGYNNKFIMIKLPLFLIYYGFILFIFIFV